VRNLNDMGRSVREGGGAVKRAPLARPLFGKLGEGLALIYFVGQGWWPVARPRFERVQTDLVLQRGSSLLLVEVKARWRAMPYERLVSATQRQRLQQQAAFWAARRPEATVRLMVVQITPSWPVVRCYALALD
jgi:Holliday junction resolvase-like predicted endonuclease